LKRIPQESEMGDINMYSVSFSATVARLIDFRARQRAAFDADLTVAAAVRRDRLKRCIAMMKAHGEDFAAAMSEDFGHRSLAQSMLTDIAASIAPARQALKQLDR
jgi:coniferyl-aldehyde dehydrogenase